MEETSGESRADIEKKIFECPNKQVLNMLPDKYKSFSNASLKILNELGNKVRNLVMVGEIKITGFDENGVIKVEKV